MALDAVAGALSKRDRAKLAKAAALVGEVIAKLDVGQEICSCCERPMSRNTTEYIWHEMLSAAAGRIGKVLGSAHRAAD